MTQPKPPTKRPLREKVDAARKKTTVYKSAEFVEDSDEETAIEPDKLEVVPVEIEIPIDTQHEPWKKNAKFLVNYLMPRSDTRQCTHTSLVGGRYFIPPEMRGNFYQQYWEALTSPTPSLFLVERYNHEDFRFFLDIDYEFTDVNVPKHIDTIAKVQQILVDLWDAYQTAKGVPAKIPTINLFPCRAASRTDWKLHVIFHKLIVDWKSTLKVGQYIQAKLDEGKAHIQLDMKVYRKGSLRMIGSNKQPDTTPTHVNETKSVYHPIDIHTGKDLEWTDRTLEEYSIFIPQEQQKYIDESKSENCMRAADDSMIFSLGSSFGRNYDEQPVQYTGSGVVSRDSDLYNCIKEHFGENIASSAGKIIHDAWTNSSTIDCSRTLYCPLAKRCHTKNHPYIALSEYGMRLKCHSTNDELCRKGGVLIPRKSLPPAVVAELPISANAPANADTPANADITTIRGRAALLQPDFVADDILTDTDVHNLTIISLSGNTTDVANLTKHFLSDEYVCVDADSQSWYHYRHPLWRFKEAKNDVKLMIGNLPQLYEGYIQAYYKNGNEKTLKQRIDTISRALNKASDYLFKDKVAKELASMSLDVRFEQMLDENRSLIGFNDGVFDLEKGEFREGKPSDMVSMTTGYDFPKQSSPKHRADLEKFMEDIQPEQANRDYLKTTCGSCLAAMNLFELFHIWSGGTRNGKSVLAMILSLTLGSSGYKTENGEISKYPYACPFEPSFLTCDRANSSSAPAPEIVAARLARVLIGAEPERGHKINSGFVKKLTGNDVLSARLLFSNEYVRFAPRFQLILICNEIPVMDHNDQAVWKRSRVIDFPVTFVDNPQMPHERQIDEGMKNKLEDDIMYRKEFMLMLIEWYYTLYKKKGLRNPPESVLRATRIYQEQSVYVGEYWSTCISKTEPSMHEHLCLDCILTDFKARENSKKGYEYKQKQLKMDLGILGVKINEGQVRCANCPARKQGVNNVRFSEARVGERNAAVDIVM